MKSRFLNLISLPMSVSELHAYAGVIGINPDEEPHLIRIAREGINAKLPEHWKPCLDTKSGQCDITIRSTDI